METLTVQSARRLALAQSGLLNPKWTGLPARGLTRRAALDHIDRFGYLQLDTVSVAGARSHAIVLMSRLEGFPPALGEELLRPGEPLFEYWGHEVCWMPVDLYPLFAFRRRKIAGGKWFAAVLKAHPGLADRILERIRKDGPLKSSDLEGENKGGWWNHKPAKRVVVALWSAGRLAVRERHAFQRTFDLPERVIPDEFRDREAGRAEAIQALLLKALEGHGWAQTGTLASTWRFINMQPEIRTALRSLEEEGRILPCALENGDRPVKGWIRPGDLDLADRLKRLRPAAGEGVLLSPFDPVLWDRKRVKQLFGFDQVLEIFKPASQRVFGYFCLPVLAGERLVARVDLKADRKAGLLTVVAAHYEKFTGGRSPHGETKRAVAASLERYSRSLGLRVSREGRR